MTSRLHCRPDCPRTRLGQCTRSTDPERTSSRSSSKTRRLRWSGRRALPAAFDVARRLPVAACTHRSS
jgi:hypothetical protein